MIITIREASKEINLEARKHPSLPILCLEDGSIIRYAHPQERCRKRTFGTLTGDGYMAVNLGGKKHYVHRLIAEAFLPNPEGKPTVDHWNRNRSDNRVVNLHFATESEQAENREFVLNRAKVKTRAKEDLATYTRERRKFVRENGHGYGRCAVIDDEAHRKSRERNARYRERHPERLKQIHHNHYLKMRSINESRS